jgi:transposase
MKKSIQRDQTILVQRERRYFSEPVRKAIVQEIEKGLGVSEAARKYEVSSTAIYKWISKYSVGYTPSIVKVIEHASETNKVKKLESELQKTYALLGKTQAEVMYLEQLIDTASASLGFDLKKNSAIRSSLNFIIEDKKSR